MKALSIRQPYATLIAEGIKDIENRSKPTKVRGKIYLHASGQWHDRLKTNSLFTKEQWLDVVVKNVQLGNGKNLSRYLMKDIDKDKLETGAIIGEVEIIDCIINHPSIWAEKTPIMGYTIENEPMYEHKPIWNWVLANAVLYDKPILNVKGKLSFWEFTTEPCEHKRINHSDGLSECLDCGTKNY